MTTSKKRRFMNFSKIHPAWLVLIACVLWASDMLVRYSVTLKVPSHQIIFWENLIGLILIIPFALKGQGRKLFDLNKSDFSLLVFLGLFGSALAGFFFNLSIQKTTPSTFSFLQIFQPLLVVYFASYLLKEKIDQMLIMWGGWVILSACLIHSNEIELGEALNDLQTQGQAIIMGLCSMVIWGLSTVIGKKLLQNHAPVKIFFWRWIFATLGTGIGFIISEKPFDYSLLLDFNFTGRLFYIGGITGALGMWFYYQGLKRLQASTTAFIELAYPALGLIFSGLFIYGYLTPVQTIGSISLMGAIIVLAKNSKIQTS